MPAAPLDADRMAPQELGQSRLGIEADLQALLAVRMEGLRCIDIEEADFLSIRNTHNRARQGNCVASKLIILLPSTGSYVAADTDVVGARRSRRPAGTGW